MGKTENVFMLDSKDTRVGSSNASVSNRLFSFSADPINFDITADWSLISITDQSSFESFLTSQGASLVDVFNFSLVGGRLKASINVEGLSSLNLSLINMTDINKLSGFDNSLQEVQLNDNKLTSFDPSIQIPNGVQYIYFDNNQITDFNPSIPLPDGLLGLFFGFNNIGVFNPSIPLPNTLTTLFLDNNNLEEFNPSNLLPTSLVSLRLDSNQIANSGYILSESWANSQPSFTNNCEVTFTDNIDSITGTNLETILLTKNTTITP